MPRQGFRRLWRARVPALLAVTAIGAPARAEPGGWPPPEFSFGTTIELDDAGVKVTK